MPIISDFDRHVWKKRAERAEEMIAKLEVELLMCRASLHASERLRVMLMDNAIEKLCAFLKYSGDNDDY